MLGVNEACVYYRALDQQPYLVQEKGGMNNCCNSSPSLLFSLFAHDFAILHTGSEVNLPALHHVLHHQVALVNGC